MLEDGDGGERIVPIIAAGGQDGRSNVALSAVFLRVRACARPRARLLPARRCPPARLPTRAPALQRARLPARPRLCLRVRPPPRARPAAVCPPARPRFHLRLPPAAPTDHPSSRGCRWHRINCVYGAASAAQSPEVQPHSKWKLGAADNAEN
jgi:hypothetical protein